MKRAALTGLFVVLAASLAVAVGTSRNTRQTLDLSGPRARTVASDRPKKPDIYYIVLDRYAGPRTLKADYGHDNEPFLNWLRQKGFSVQDRGRANYPRTSHSVASTLNMRYLDDLAGKSGPMNFGPVYKLLKRPLVARFLKSRGYRYIKLGSWWKATSSDPFADKNYHYDRPEYINRYAEVHGLTRRERFREGEYVHRHWQYKILRTVIPKMRGPKFTWVHILCPHEPFLINAKDQFLSNDPVSRKLFPRSRPLYKSNAENYLQQVLWTNEQLKTLVNTLLKGPVSSRPVIAIVADEGPYDGLTPSSTTGITIHKMKQKLYVMNAVYLPGVENPPFFDSISSVNTFRIIFNLYFGTKYALLPDRSFIFTRHSLYHYLDVTELITH